ncbi:hypothetical protein [Gymnodinialimonas ulvae]|uniref:hypothetical protein n=1 Tax=Gymnodinialimonas ulvae TaxID=3126504 RepID=UPI0030A6AE14
MTTDSFPSEYEIDEFALGFYGYGDLKAPLWFVGMEEGGGNTADEVTKRIRAWQIRGCMKLEDVAEYHDAFMKEGFSSIRKQNTWSALSRVQLGYERKLLEDGDVKQHWKKSLGRHRSGTCILELNPLPSPGTSAWKYPEFTKLPFLVNRDAYNLRYGSERVATLRRMILAYSPRAVVFYGRKYETFWSLIAGAPLVSQGLHKTASNGKIKFASIDHPSAPVAGATSEYYASLGRGLAET